MIPTVLLVIGGVSCSAEEDDEGGKTTSTIVESSTEPTTGQDLLGIVFGPSVDGADPYPVDIIDPSTVLRVGVKIDSHAY